MTDTTYKKHIRVVGPKGTHETNQSDEKRETTLFNLDVVPITTIAV